MKITGQILSFIITLAIFIGIGWLAYLGIRFIIDQFEVIDQRTGAVLTILSVVIILSASILGGAIRSAIRSADKTIHPEKAIIYKKFLDIWYSNNNIEEYPREHSDLDKAMSLWASDGVLKQYLSFKNSNKSSEIQETLMKVRAEKVVLAMRKDLGQQNFGIRSGSINNMLNKTKSPDNKII